jgi:hypothetical protein
MNFDDKRIYVVVAHTVNGLEGSVVEQPLGRQIAQACHAVSLSRHEFIHHTRGRRSETFPNITTIILTARDTEEVRHLHKLLTAENIPFVAYQDENDEAYGVNHRPTTALATWPIESVDVRGILDYLPLWGSSRHIKAG